jgi:hypothetical protein
MIKARNGKISERLRKLKIFPISLMIWEIIICMFIGLTTWSYLDLYIQSTQVAEDLKVTLNAKSLDRMHYYMDYFGLHKFLMLICQLYLLVNLFHSLIVFNNTKAVINMIAGVFKNLWGHF